MKLRQVSFTAILTAFALGTVEARIGETPAELQQRFKTFGQVGPDGSRAYIVRDLKITVFFLEGVSQAEVVTKQPKQQDGLSSVSRQSQFTNDEIKILLQANGAGHTWIETGSRHWKRSDDLVLAYYEPYHYSGHENMPQFVFCSAKFAARLKLGKASEEADKKAEEKRKAKEALSDY